MQLDRVAQQHRDRTPELLHAVTSMSSEGVSHARIVHCSAAKTTYAICVASHMLESGLSTHSRLTGGESERHMFAGVSGSGCMVLAGSQMSMAKADVPAGSSNPSARWL